MEPIILASSSPRRQKILKFLNIPFIVNPANIDETIPADIKPEEAAEFLAARKIDAVAIILHKNKIFGKPKNQDEAREFLNSLQGTTHKVITGIALFNGTAHYMATRTSVNKVTFAAMSEAEIESYLETSEWHGAAGAYRIQGKASCFIKKIEGTESSVMGLPIFELYDMLKEQNYKFTV